MASLFVLARNAVTFSNSASFPFYVLGGILVPVSLLPHWIRPLSSIVFLSWSADLLRAGLRSSPIHDFGYRLGMVGLLGACGLGVGVWAMHVILRRVRGTGELGTT
jgi:ABC-2 type transport system permease protein